MGKNGKRKIHILLGEDLHKRIRIRCAVEDRSIQKYVVSVLQRDMEGFEIDSRLSKNQPGKIEGE